MNSRNNNEIDITSGSKKTKIEKMKYGRYDYLLISFSSCVILAVWCSCLIYIIYMTCSMLD